MSIKIDYRKLRRWCKGGVRSTFRKAKRLGGVLLTKQGGSFVFKDNGASVLAVAHCDTACKQEHFYWLNCSREPIIMSPKLDDRLGVYVIVDLLPSLGVEVDWLLTEGEERMGSSAAEFTSEKQYNWLVSFDRGGSDVVVYEYGSEATGFGFVGKKAKPMNGWEIALKEFFPHINGGSYSCLCELEGLKCKGVNIGVGMENYHSVHAIVYERVLTQNVLRFVRFWEKHRGTRFEHQESAYYGGGRRYAISGASKLSYRHGYSLEEEYEGYDDGYSGMYTKRLEYAYHKCPNCDASFAYEDGVEMFGETVCPECAIALMKKGAT